MLAPRLRVAHRRLRREGRDHAAAWLAAERDGGAHAGERAAARVAVVKAGAFGILRVIYNVFGVALLRSRLCTWLAGSRPSRSSPRQCIAIFQDNFKRRLAYSTVSQLSYIVLGASLLTPYAATAAIVHIANQAFAKITMFFVAGAISARPERRQIHELAGIGYRMPYTMAAFTMAALSFIGVPLFAGFITKWYLSLGALEAEKPWFVLVMVRELAAQRRVLAADRVPGVLQGAAERRRSRSHEAQPDACCVPTLICARLRDHARATTEVARYAVLARTGGRPLRLRDVGGGGRGEPQRDLGPAPAWRSSLPVLGAGHRVAHATVLARRPATSGLTVGVCGQRSLLATRVRPGRARRHESTRRTTCQAHPRHLDVHAGSTPWARCTA